MKIALVTQSAALGGVERVLEQLVRGLDKRRFELVVLCSDAPEISGFIRSIEGHAHRVIPTPLVSTHTEGPKWLTVLKLSLLLRRLAPDVVHIHATGPFGGRYIAAACAVAGVRATIMSPHTLPSGRASLCDRFVTQLLDANLLAIVVPSRAARRLQIEQLGRSPARLRVIHNAVDLGEFDRETTPAAVFGPRGAQTGTECKVVGTIARLEPGKGVPEFLAAAKLIREAVPSVRFLVIGEGSLRTEYERLALALGLAEHVTFSGHRADVAACLAAMDIFVLASHSESFGLVIAEAMAMGKPVVASDVGGIPELVDDGLTGYVVPTHDPRACAEKVVGYLRDPELAKRHGAEGMRRVQSQFAASHMVTRYEALYADVLRSDPAF